MCSFTQIYYQIVFGTKYRKPTINEVHTTERKAFLTNTKGFFWKMVLCLMRNIYCNVQPLWGW
jgi:hypothetical protein